MKQIRPCPVVLLAAAALVLLCAGVARGQNSAWTLLPSPPRPDAENARVEGDLAAEADAAEKLKEAESAVAVRKEAEEAWHAAQAKAAAAEQAVADAQAAVAAAAKATAVANKRAADTAAALARAKTQAAANPSDKSLAWAVTAAELDAKVAAQAAADAKKAMDAKITAMFPLAPMAKEAEKVAADAQAVETAKAGLADQATKAAQAAHQTVLGLLRVQDTFAASRALSQKCHFIAMLMVPVQGTSISVRYDSYPGLERVVAPNGGLFERAAGKGWMEKTDWTKPGAPASAERVAKLDSIAEFAQRAFQPVAPNDTEGALMWRPMAGGASFEQSRESPLPGKIYPKLSFFVDPLDNAGTLLHAVSAPWTWDGAPVNANIWYFYFPKETAPPADGTPEEKLAAAIHGVAAGPFMADATFLFPAGRIHVAGMVSGEDFDLTVHKDGKAWRQIAVGAQSWSSTDGGATWKKEEAVDRTWAGIIRYAMDGGVPGWPLAWPFVPGAPTATAEGQLLQYNMVSPGGESWTPQVSYWFMAAAGKPPELRRYGAAKAVIGKLSGSLYVSFGRAADARGVLPPPGNPAAVPPDGSGELLADAVRGMREGEWKVEYVERTQSELGGWKDGPQAWRIRGIVAGEDFDLTAEEGASGLPGATKHTIGIKEKTWTSAGNGGGWLPGDPNPKFARSAFDMAHGPLTQEFTNKAFEIVGTEGHDGETWLHIRCISAQFFLDSGPDYWLQLDKTGHAVAVRRCVWAGDVPMLPGVIMMSDTIDREYYEVNFTPAKEEIKPPEAAE